MLERWPMKLQLKIKKFCNHWNETKLAGNDWLYGFMKGNSDLSLRKPEACSLSRAAAFNKHTVAAFFEKLKKCL